MRRKAFVVLFILATFLVAAGPTPEVRRRPPFRPLVKDAFCVPSPPRLRLPLLLRLGQPVLRVLLLRRHAGAVLGLPGVAGANVAANAYSANVVVQAALLLSSFAALPVLGQAPPTDFWAVRPWEMWAATPPHMKLCTPPGRCYSLRVAFPDRHILQWQDNPRYSVTAVLADGGVGVVRDYGEGALRCFSDTTDSCEPARFPPGYSPGFDIIPVLAAPSSSGVTPAAKVYYALQTEQVNSVNLVTCEVTWIGPVIHSGAHFLVSSYDFGPQLGVLANVYVTEEAMGCPATTGNPMFCQRLERYFFAPGLGRVRQEGWTDVACDGVNPETCQGNYHDLTIPGEGNWIPSDGPPVDPISEICP